MKIGIRITLILLIILSSIILCGCWNYTDIEKYSIVIGLSVDRDKINDKYILNAEIMSFEMSGKEAKSESRIIESEGDTVFDAIRDIMNANGNRLYWGHAKIFIISKDIAREGIIPVLDLAYRDAEMREEMHVLVSNKSTAKELLQSWSVNSELGSFEIDKIIEDQKVLSNAPMVTIYELVNDIEERNVSPTLPMFDTVKKSGKITPCLIGTAIFKSDKLIGFLNKEKSKYFLFATNRINKGLLIENIKDGNRTTKVTLEIFDSKTKVNPVCIKGSISINMNISVDAAIAEIDGSTDFIRESGRDKLKHAAENSLKTSVENLIYVEQHDYDSDIFEFGKLINADIPSAWDKIKENWDEAFMNLHTNVTVDIQLRNSALNIKSIKRGR